MYLESTILFLATMASGAIALSLPKAYTIHFDPILTFGGSYLFGITLVHILPELFEHADPALSIGHYLLAGFFLQLILDFFGGSVAHGHAHTTHKSPAFHAKTPITTLFGALLLHAFLEGYLLEEANSSLWFAIVLHKLPVIFTLATLLRQRQKNTSTILILLGLFSLATPLNFILREQLQHYEILTKQTILKLHAIATGGLFHIATIILFESNPQHHLNKARWCAIVTGIGLALASNHFITH